MKKYIIPFLLLWLASLFSQENLQVDLSAGFSNIGPTLVGSCHYNLSENRLLTGRYLHSQTLLVAAATPLATEEIKDISLLYTFKIKERLFLSTGLGYSWGTIPGEMKHEEIKFSTPSLPVNLYFNFVSIPYLKVGLNCFGILNPKMSVGGAAISLSLAD